MSAYDEKQIKIDDKEYIAGTYGRNNVVLTKGKNCEVYDANNKKYLDFTSGIGVNSLGFCDDNWINAVTEQLKLLQHTSNLYYTEPCVTLAKELCTKTGMKNVFFANSGAEANEGAIKAARKYSFDKYGQERYTIVTLDGSFHGRTLAALTATGQDAFHPSHFAPFPSGFAYVKANDFTQMQNYINEDKSVCAIMLEIVQGEGGVVLIEEEYLKNIENLCKENDILLIVDEVQTGIGRTGTLLAIEQYGIKADIITLAKGLGGGLPIGAILFGEKTQKTFGASDHGSTFGANPVVCAGANEVLKRLTPQFLQEVKQKGELLKSKLEKIDKIKEVNAKGLMFGIVLNDDITAKDVLLKCEEKGLLCLTAKTKLRLLPPLTVSENDINEAVKIIENVLEEM